MVCGTCNTVFDDRHVVCPSCGTAGTGSRIPVRARRWRWLRAALLALGTLALVLLVTTLLALRYLPLSVWTAPLVLEVLARANDHPEAVNVLGRPVRFGWRLTGQVRADETGWREFLLTVGVKGARDRGTLHVRAGRAARGAWTYTALELEPPGAPRIDLLTPPRLPRLPASRPVFLVPLGPLEYVSLEDLARYYRARFGLDIRTLSPVDLTAPLIDHPRNQIVAEVVIEWLRWHLRGVAEDPSAVVIAITEHDMYIRSRKEPFALEYRGDDRFAVVSVARMLPAEDTSRLVALARRMLDGYRLFGQEYVVHARVRKLVGQQLGLLAYRFPTTSDPTSLLYARVKEVPDLDAMRDSFEPVSLGRPLGAPVSHRQPQVEPELIPRTAPVTPAGGYPCFLVRPAVTALASGKSPPATIETCQPGMRTEREYDELEVNLRSGMFVARKTDLFVPGLLPIALTRCYRMWDEEPRAFGIGTNHPYDTFLSGNRQPYTRSRVSLADGSGIGYERISKGTGYADAVYEHVETTSPFFGSRLQWNGSNWDLRFPDQSLFVFPESYAARRSAEAALIEMRDGAGRAVTLTRDRRRNLVEVIAPEGGFIKLEHDSLDLVRGAADHRGRVVRYEYDIVGRLVGVTDAEGRAARYVYDAARLVAVESVDGASRVDIRYFHERVSQLRLPDGRVYRFRFIFEPSEDRRPAHAVVTDPDGTSTDIDVKTGARQRVAPGR